MLDSLLLKCRQLTDEQHLIAVLLEQLDLGEMVFDVLYSCHLPLLEYITTYITLFSLTY